MRLAPETSEPRDGIRDDLVDWCLVVDDPVDEGCIGAVLEQAPHEIGQEILVAADGRVNAAGPVELVGADDLLVERLAHAVQALKLVIPAFTRELEHGGERVCVVRGELPVESVGRRKQPPRAREIGDVGCDLAREDGVARKPALLAALDLAVPVGALDQPHHEPAAGAAREIGKPVYQRERALLVGLHREPEPVPARERRLKRQPLDHVEREVEPLGFLGVDRESDALRFGVPGERQQDRRQLAERALALRLHIARMQSRELHGNAGSGEHVASRGSGTDGGNRRLVALEISAGVPGSARGLAEHVVGMAVALLLGAPRALERLGDGPAHHELSAEDAHGGSDGLAHHRLAGARDQALQHASEISLRAIRPDQASRQHERPGGRVDEE